MLLLASILACEPSEVTATGTVYAGPASATPAAGGTITIRDAEAAVFDSAPIGADGRFEVLTPADTDLFAEIAIDGSVPTTFAGQASISDFEAEPGALYGLPDLAERLAPFAGCPGADWDGDAGGIVLGEVRFSDLRDAGTGGLPVAPNAIVKVAIDGSEDQLVTACMLDDEGAWDPAATQVGATGQFVVTDLPPGIHQLRVGLAITDSGFDFDFYELWVPDGGASPWFPVAIAFLE